MSGFNKTNIKIYPLNKTDFKASEIMTVRLPVITCFDLHSQAMHFKATSSEGISPKHASSVIGRLEVLINGVSTGSAEQEYNTVHSLIANVVVGYDKQLEQETIPMVVTFMQCLLRSQSLTIDKWHGFLGANFIVISRVLC